MMIKYPCGKTAKVGDIICIGSYFHDSTHSEPDYGVVVMNVNNRLVVKGVTKWNRITPFTLDLERLCNAETLGRNNGLKWMGG